MPNYDEYASLWEGNSPNVNHAYRRMVEAGQAPDNSWLERLFGRRQPDRITSAPLPPMEVTDEGRFPPSPFGGAPAPAAPKPASKLSSGADIAKRVAAMLGAPEEPPPVSPADFGLPPSEYMVPQSGDPLAAAVNAIPNAEAPPVPRVPISMTGNPDGLDSDQRSVLEILRLLGNRGGGKFGGNTFGGNKFGGHTFGGNTFGGRQFGASAPRDPGETGGTPMVTQPQDPGLFPPTGDQGRADMVAEADERRRMQDIMRMAQMFERLGVTETGGAPNLPEPQAGYGGRRFGGSRFGGNTYGGATFGGNRFGASARSPFATGGDVPGLMRGGYPELYNAPIRHFDSGGQSYVDGYGDSDGRADDVSARLSPKEYVVDAETMSMLGDGNPDAGAKKMDQFRSNVRKHKGKALAKGKFSPNAKSPMEYLAGNPMGDGMRRLGKRKQ